MTKETKSASRRDFLKLAGTVAPVAAVAVATSGTSADAKPVDLQSDTIQDTAHTRAYLESTRF